MVVGERVRRMKRCLVWVVLAVGGEVVGGEESRDKAAGVMGSFSGGSSVNM